MGNDDANLRGFRHHLRDALNTSLTIETAEPTGMYFFLNLRRNTIFTYCLLIYSRFDGF